MLEQLVADNIWFIAAGWMGLAFVASLVSIRLGVSVALIEIGMGVIGGNFLGFQTTPWIDFLATFGAGLLTFLAGAEIEPEALRRHLKPTLVIGSVAFFAPFFGAWLFAQYVAGWEQHAAWIAGIALSTTSVAVVYAVMVETGLNQTELGKLILAACFVNDFGTVLALGVLFANFNGYLVLFIAVLAVGLSFMPRWTRFLMKNVGNRVSEPEIKFIFFGHVMDEARAVATEQGVTLETEVLVGHAAQAIVQRAQQLGADLIVLGHSGHSSVWGNLMGTTADKVAHHAPCDVLVVR